MTTRPLHVAETGVPEQVDVFDGVATVCVGDTLLVLWRTAACDSRIRHVSARTVGLIARYPGGIAAAQLLLPSASPPGLSEVGAVREALRSILPKARRLVTVPLGDSRWKAVVRTVMRAGLALLGQSERIKVAATQAEALELLVAAGGDTAPGRAELAGALEALFAALGERPPREST
jgi:hypothetical protein